MSLIVAEIGTSHEGSLEKAKDLIDASLSSGADAVKFQWVYADEILHPDTGCVSLPTGTVRLYDRFKSLECGSEFFRELCDYTHKKGGAFVCSPFGLKSLGELLSIHPDYIKIASPELNHYPLLNALCDYRNAQKSDGKNAIPVIISSGVSRLSDIEVAIEIIGRENVTLLHCVTSYPAPESEYNVRLITNLKHIFGIETGVSDHSLDASLIPVLSVMCGASVIEKHITLSRKTNGLDDPVALEPAAFSEMVHEVHQAEAVLRHYGETLGGEKIIEQLSEAFSPEKIRACLGDGVKRLAASEKENYSRTNRSLHYMRTIKKGEKITTTDIALLRTEKELSVGVNAEFLPVITGKTLFRDVKSGDGVKLEDFLYE